MTTREECAAICRRHAANLRARADGARGPVHPEAAAVLRGCAVEVDLCWAAILSAPDYLAQEAPELVP